MKRLFITLLILFPLISSADSVLIEVDTKAEQINAIEGSIVLPTSFVAERVETGDSVVLIWIEGPTINQSAHTISFAGLTPGGFSGKKPLFRIVGESAKKAVTSIRFSGITALRSDGEGTRAKATLSAKVVEDATDIEPPVPFEIGLSESEDLFQGKLFASFLTQDKQTGVAKYEVAERLFFGPAESDWQESSSPYEISDSLYIKKLYVRATDQAGNYIIESRSLPNRKYVLIFLAILIIVLCVTLVRRLRKRQLSSYSY